MGKATDDPSTKIVLVQPPETDKQQPLDGDNSEVPKGVNKGWLDSYSQISAYAKFPTPNTQLNEWIRNQKIILKGGGERGEAWNWKIDKLQNLGFNLFSMSSMEYSPAKKRDPKITEGVNTRFSENYNQVLAFMKANNGSLPTPTTSSRLYNFLHAQKLYLRSHQLHRGEAWFWRLGKLKDIGFDVPVGSMEDLSGTLRDNLIPKGVTKEWLQQYCKVLAFVKATTGSRLTLTTNKKLYQWIYNQKRILKESALRGKVWSWKVERMKDVGFDIDTTSIRKWKNRFASLVAYKEKYGTCDVEVTIDHPLYCWIFRQRKNWNHLTSEQQQMLQGIGFSTGVLVDKRAPSAPTKNQSQESESSPSPLSYSERQWRQWNDNFSKLKVFKELHGHCLVPVSERGLGIWVKTQRQLHRQKKLKRERFDRLEALKFSWRVYGDEKVFSTTNWYGGFNCLMAYKRTYGDCLVPKSQEMLGKWIDRQHLEYRNGTLSEAHQKQLENLGFVWDAHNVTTATPVKEFSKTAGSQTETPCDPRGKVGAPTSATQSGKRERSGAGATKEHPFRITPALANNNDGDHRSDGPVRTRNDPFTITPALANIDGRDHHTDKPVRATPAKKQKKTRKRILFAGPPRKRVRTVSVVAKGSSDQPVKATIPTIPPPQPERRRMSLWADVPILQPQPELWNGINPLQNPDPFDNIEL